MLTCRHPTTLFFVRHGQSLGNLEERFGGHSDTELSERGREQAQEVAALLVDSPSAQLVTSDLPRARQTAAIIAEVTDWPVEESAAWRERTVGVLDGLSFVEAAAQHPELWAKLQERDPDFVPPGGESVRAARRRIAESLAELCVRHDGGCLVLVSHQIALSLALQHVLGLPEPTRDRPGPFFQLFNGSITEVKLGVFGTVVKSINRTDHLQEG